MNTVSIPRSIVCRIQLSFEYSLFFRKCRSLGYSCWNMDSSRVTSAEASSRNWSIGMNQADPKGKRNERSGGVSGSRSRSACRQPNELHWATKLYWRFWLMGNKLITKKMLTQPKIHGIWSQANWLPYQVTQSKVAFYKHGLFAWTHSFSPLHAAGGMPIQTKYWKVIMQARKQQYLGQISAMAFLLRRYITTARATACSIE